MLNIDQHYTDVHNSVFAYFYNLHRCINMMKICYEMGVEMISTMNKF